MNNKIIFSDEPPPQKPTYKLGQFWRNVKTNILYFLGRSPDGTFCLTNLETGHLWADGDVEDIFDGDESKFILVTSPFTIAPSEL